MSWAVGFIGIPYGTCDCVELVELIQRVQFERKVSLPSNRPQTSFSKSELIQHELAAYKETDDPRDGDIVLMRAHGRLNHVGVYVSHSCHPKVLHSLKAMGQSALHDVRALRQMKIEIEGYYKWQ